MHWLWWRRPSFLLSGACLDEFNYVMSDKEKFERALVILLDEDTKFQIHNVQACNCHGRYYC